MLKELNLENCPRDISKKRRVCCSIFGIVWRGRSNKSCSSDRESKNSCGIGKGMAGYEDLSI